jgi:hypothetical protein
LNINDVIITIVAKVLVTARDTQYHFCFKRNYMADEMSVPGVNPTEEQIAFTMGALQDKLTQANDYYSKVMSQITKLKDRKMAEVMSPGGIMMGGGDGGLGFGSGGGLIGGLILGSLLRNGQGGGLFGSGADGGGAAAVTGQATANMQLMQSIGAVDKSVAVNAAQFEASQATQSLGLTNQFNNITASLASRTDGVKDAVNANAMVLAQQLAALSQTTMENRYELSKDISADGEKTRALITSQYEINLQRQLSDANAAIIELRGDSRLAERTRGIEVNTTTTVNQMQQQSQQQAQYGQLANMIWALGQNIRNDNAAINVGSGTQTSTPTNTNTNIR